jgi:lipoxygenase homology domain-containing protein 1
VYIELIGSLATSGQHKLDNAPDNFTRGKTDTFNLACRDLGSIEKIRLLVAAPHSAKADSDWHLETVHVSQKEEANASIGKPLGSFYHRSWVFPRQVSITPPLPSAVAKS